MNTLQIQDSFQPYYAGRKDPAYTRKPAEAVQSEGCRQERPPGRRGDMRKHPAAGRRQELTADAVPFRYLHIAAGNEPPGRKIPVKRRQRPKPHPARSA